MNLVEALEKAFYLGYDLGKNHGTRLTEQKFLAEAEKRNVVHNDIEDLAAKVDEGAPV